jgi:hypothetical protein
MTRHQGRASFRRRAREAVTVKHDKGSGPNGYRVDVAGFTVDGNAWSYKAARARRAEVVEALVDFFVPREAPVPVERDETDDSL